MSASRLSKLSKREKAGALAVGIVVLLALVALLVIRPLTNRFHELDEQIAAADKKAGENQRILSPSMRESTLRDYAKYGSYIMKPATTTTAEENAAMLAELETQARGCGVGLSSTKPLVPQIEPDFEEYSVEVEIDADMRRLISFLYDVEASNQLLRVKKLQLDSKSGTEGGGLKGRLVITKVVTL
jgi:hypothetical protein